MVLPVFVIMVFCLVLQSFYWIIAFKKLRIYKENGKMLKYISRDTEIVVCSRNELQNLENLLPLLKEQLIDDIHIVDDASTDGTFDYLTNYCTKNKGYKIHRLEDSKPGKKEALNVGISKVEKSYVLLTDADCLPTKQWSETMTKLPAGKEIVLGFSPNIKTKSYLNLWVRYETVLTAIQYLSACLNGLPYMGVGRNLLYNKDLITRSIDKHEDLSSGDDDLTINQIATQENCTIQIDRKAWVYTSAVGSWKSYFEQKKRHFSTSHRYQKKHIIYLTGFSLSWVFFYVCLCILLLSGSFFLAGSFYMIRLIITIFATRKLFLRLGFEDGAKFWPLLDLLTPLYFLVFSLFTLPNRKQSW